MLRLIGDVHGLYPCYKDLIKNVPFSIQLGDFGFQYDCLSDVDSNCHKVLGGNHDNYYLLPHIPHNLGDFGTINIAGYDIFFIRGELSVDKQYRIEGVSWWSDEQITYVQANDCIEAYAKAKPDLVISHGCPEAVLKDFITNEDKLAPSFTTRLLGQLFQIHQPKRWFFGHHHINKEIKKENTIFRCIDEVSFVDLD
jgi:predicted phosphodiesterase